ncbi:MAG: L,D-transpeptidase [Candidatus Cloacimonetes bacterium]|nr:L,D-transpeptidase [Candidatus Cloacimonadota bacterium]
MNEINFLRDSRGGFHHLSRAKKILLLTSFYSGVSGIGVLGGMFLGKNFFSEPGVVAAEKSSKVGLVDAYPTVTPELQGPREEDFRQAESVIASVASAPIKIAFSTKSERIEYNLDTEAIRSFLTTSVWGNEVLVVIKNSNFDNDISHLAEKVNRKSKIESPDEIIEADDRVLDEVKLKQILRDELWGRKNGRKPRVEFSLAELVYVVPGTAGDLAEKYLEVDLSQQKLYRWQGGEVIGTHIVSTGKYGPTPIGIHKIKNKAKLAWSPPAQVWMPFWMAYGYNPSLQAYLGFHELPYWDGPNGTRIRRPFDTLGIPVTGGCIQLNIGDAEEVYNWTEVGTPVLIHE